MSAAGLLDRGLFPDWVVRKGIRRLLRSRLQREDKGSEEANRVQLEQYVATLRERPLAVETRAANEQHYEVPTAFFEKILGPHMKYSSGLWSPGVSTLEEAEAAMLQLTVERGELEDGMEVLDLGCGWGSLALWIGRRFPGCRVLAVSNSWAQRAYIESRCHAMGLENVSVVTHDINEFQTTRRFDRVFSVEMFEHLQNYEELLRRIAAWMQPGGLLFAHLFVHKTFAYPFEVEGAANWMGRNFFTGGQMPSADLLPRFQDDMALVSQWTVDGTHYARTARRWLANLDANRAACERILARDRGPRVGRVEARRWRVFLMACEELWGFRKGTEWFVSHYLFRPMETATARQRNDTRA